MTSRPMRTAPHAAAAAVVPVAWRRHDLAARTDTTLLRPSLRNGFQPQYQHLYAKFRLAFDAESARG